MVPCYLEYKKIRMTWEMEMKVKVRKLMQNIDSGIQYVSKVGFHKRRLGNVVRHFLLLPLFRGLHFSSSYFEFVPYLSSYLCSPPLFFCLRFISNF